MDVVNDLEGLIRALDFAEAAGDAEWMPPARAAAPASAPPPEPKAEPELLPDGDSAEVEPIFTRRREATVPSPTAPLPNTARGRGDRQLWAVAVAAAAFVASSIALGVTTAMSSRPAAPVVLRVVKAVPPPAKAEVVPAGMPVPQPQSPLPAGRPWSIKDLPNLGGVDFPPAMGEAQLHLLKEDLRKTLQHNGYLPPGYTPPGLPAGERREGVAPGVRFTSTKAAYEQERP